MSSAKRHDKEKVESDFRGSDTKNTWAGLMTMTRSKGAACGAGGLSVCAGVKVQKAHKPCPLVLNRADVCRSFNLLSLVPVFQASARK